MILTQAKEDKIYNALVIGMALEDAYIYAGLSPAEIEAVAEDTALQLKWRQISKEFEFGLLNRMNEVSVKQAKLGREQATTWMLEHMFPRYSGKPQNEGGEVHLHFNNVDPATYDTVEIFDPHKAEREATSQQLESFDNAEVNNTEEPITAEGLGIDGL